MRMLSKLVAVALAASLQPVMAGTLVLDFEDLTTTKLLSGTYNGVDISGSAWSARSNNGNCGGTISFERGETCTALLIANDPGKLDVAGEKSVTLGLTGGFVDAVSFAYSGKTNERLLSVTIFDAQGGTLASLVGLEGSECASGFVYCNWSDADGPATTLSFKGVASYITFTAAKDNTVLLDSLNFTLATGTPPQALPEPGSVALAFGALGALGWTRRRTAR